MIEGFEDAGDLHDELDAAKERIEKLEAALREIADDGGKDLFISGRSAQRIARKALEKNDD